MPFLPPMLSSHAWDRNIGHPDATHDSPDQRAAFVFRGIAIGDFALAALAYERAMAVGKGTRVS